MSQEELAASGMENDEDGFENEENSAAEDDIYKNNHDLIGIKGILTAQQHEIEKKKLELRMENERYLREHKEISGLLALFVSKILDDRPENILEYAGTFFDSARLRDVVEGYIKKENELAEKQKYLNDLIKGKTLI